MHLAHLCVASPIMCLLITLSPFLQSQMLPQALISCTHISYPHGGVSGGRGLYHQDMVFLIDKRLCL